MSGSTLWSNEHFLLPEHHSDMTYSLKRKIERAGSFTIISPSLNNKLLAKSIEKALNTGAELTLITADGSSAAYYAKYNNVHVYLPPSKRSHENFSLTLLLIDQSDVCFIGSTLDEAALSGTIANGLCTTNSEEIAFASAIKTAFIKRFSPYHR